MTSWQRMERLSMILALGVMLWPIWGNAYFLTNDGPCHLYNARILRDMLLGQDTAFYGDWYTLNPRLDPNWLSHILLILFQMVLPAVLSEKLLLTLYVLGFVLGFRYMARAIHPANAAFALLVVPFAYHKVFIYGFYNYCLSLVLLFFLLGHWLRYWDSRELRHWLGLGGWMLLLGIAHPVGYALGMGCIACHAGGLWLLDGQAGRFGERSLAFLKLAARTVAAGLPSLVLLLLFLTGHENTVTPSTVKFHTLFHHMLQLKALIVFHPHEADWPQVLAVSVGVLLLVGLVRLRGEGFRHLGLLLMLGAALYAYFNQPAMVGRVGIVPERLQPVPYLIALVWIVAQPWPGWLRRLAMLTGLLVTLVLGFKRMPDFARTSDAVEEFVTAGAHMEPHKTVVMLNYAPEGKYPHGGPRLSTEAYVFGHITEYLGTQRPLIVLNNYEANTGWFPLLWRPGRDPFVHLGVGPGFEGWLPTVDFEKFRRETGKELDYVITWCLGPDLHEFDGVKVMQERLGRDYDEIYVSEGDRVRLYRRH